MIDEKLTKHLQEQITNNTENIESIIEKDFYSTTEQLIGKWINGKNLYRRVFTGNTGTSNYWRNAVADVPNNLKITKLTAIIGDYLPVPIYIDSSYYVALQYNSSANAIQTYNKGYPNSDIEIVVEYTKKDN